MKKIITIFLCILLISVLAVPALAAQSATMSVATSQNTAYRGDTITVTVSSSKVDNCTSGGFMFSFDKNVFEYVGGSAVLTGYTAGVSTAAGNVAGYFMNGNATVQGNIFKITLKVKDNAAFGSYNISGVPNMSAADGAVSCSAGGTTVTVVCSHSYGSWSKADDNDHSRTCSICQNVQEEAHKWDNGTVTEQANCKEGGQIKYTCTACSATKTVDTDKTTDHKYGGWTKVSNTQHKHICSICSKEETANHSWDGGSVTKVASCKEEGVKTFTCTACSATKTESIDKTTDHKYGSWIKVNDTTHKHTCSVCSKEETANHSWNGGSVTKAASCKETGVKTYTCTACNAIKTESIAKLTTHTYDHACDTDCNVCGATRTTTHNYKTAWSKDKTSHWYECSVCKDKKDIAAHTPSAEATENKAQTCSICGYIIKAALGHKHDYATAWTTDDTGHWYKCSGCEEMGSYAAHDFENNCDKDCSVCGYTRNTEHEFTEAWTVDANNHWHECSGCGLKQDESAHEPSAEATATTAQICTICDYEIAPALGGAEETQPESAEPVEKELDNGWVIGGVIVIVVIGGLATGIIIWKRRK